MRASTWSLPAQLRLIASASPSASTGMFGSSIVAIETKRCSDVPPSRATRRPSGEMAVSATAGTRPKAEAGGGAA